MRDLTLMERECPADVFDTARMLSSNGSISPFTSGSHVLSPLAVQMSTKSRRSGWPGSGTQVAIGHEKMSSGGLSSGACRPLYGPP